MYKFTRKERTFLGLQRVGRLALVGRNGFPHVSPFCHVLSKGVIYIEGDADSWKVRNASRRKEAAYVVDEYTESWDKNLRGVRLQGTMDVLREGAEYQAAKRVLIRKFPQLRSVVNWDDKLHVVMKLTPTSATNWGL